MTSSYNLTVNSTVLVIIIVVLLNIAYQVEAEIHGMPEPNCPGTCTSVFDCKSIGGKILGNCANGKLCCSGGFNIPTGSCGSSVMAPKVSSFQSPNYPTLLSGSLICEFTLQLNPATVGIRVDFVDLNLRSIPNNPINFSETPNPICDSDFMLFRGFSGWSPDLRCGNLTGYSLMIDREAGQPSLSTIFIMGSNQYKWKIQYTEIYYSEVESLDYALRNARYNVYPSNAKKQWIWYPAPVSPPLSPLGPPGLPPSLVPGPIAYQFHDFQKRDLNSSFEVKSANAPLISGTIVDNNSLRPVPRVVGGIDAQPNSSPWIVSLQLVEKMPSAACGQDNIKNMSSHFCGGSIVGERTIVTASHCFSSPSRYTHPLVPAGSVKVVVGEHDFCSDTEVSSTKEYDIERVILHYNYLSSDVINDIAVIQLTKPILFSEHVYPIPMPDAQTKVDHLKPLLAGWGSLGVEENSTYPTVLQESSNINIFSEQQCQTFQREFLDYVVRDEKLPGKYRGAFTTGICTQPTDNVTEAGYGDSGGPLAGIPPAGDSGRPVLLGIVSHMRTHNDPKTGQSFHLNYFVKVASYRRWIIMSML